MARIKHNLPNSAYLDNPLLRLVNRKHKLRAEIDFKKFKIGRESFDIIILDNLLRFLSDAEKRMFKLTLVSGYRSIDYQKKLFNRALKKYQKKGLTEKEAREKVLEYLQAPGASEHHTGLAVDIIDSSFLKEKGDLYPEVDQLQSQEWLINNAPKYGFILRFPKDKEGETGVKYESWHFRYVGVENAKFIHSERISLEEYIKLLKKEKRNKIFIRTQYNA
ncbi:peptidase M15 [Oenococcus oeni]|uniref:D-alanyl-D-alanine carboxypeptidase family protein n=1 Tax=Oenococcus oeni TaxID=1247 RepID=A0A483B8A5_OENOE|nr:M15 family metallopeptidase [Oenococcus oeni]MDV7714693.1 D-alanyl-D-alanine carboxypeptidase family protein [Oenococcus oeni]OIM24807.1 peptidase M15 [Oenococcus oeni]SYW00517.1 D-alanyl-D-alanine carboxypeptidase [Oenococcus oeni]SYW07318.1 D-alanyl-D-alanine carboxypeptidase [Oenococcus oeni]SYW21106.1 D-alanyl-D-alanine carboxypeptidase [Oenococcus oeni]